MSESYLYHFFRRSAPTAVALIALLAQPAAPVLAQSTSNEHEAVNLEAFEVTGTRPQLVESSTMKLPARILETPRSVSIIDATRIDQQNFQNANDVLDWVPGMNGNAGSYHFFARGFRMGPNDWKVDGFAGRVVGGSYSPNLFGYEQMVALKGPAGVLYGSTSQPGGQINLITKKPLAETRVVTSARVRSYLGGGLDLGDENSLEFDLDATGPLTADGRLRYRTLISEEQGHDAVGADDDGHFYRTSLSYALDAEQRFVITPSIEWSSEFRNQRPIALSPSTSRSTSDGRTDYSLADITPAGLNLSAGGRTDKNLTASLDFTARLSDDWNLNASVRHHDRTYANDAWAIQTGTLTQTDPADDRSWTVQRRHSRTRRDYENTAFDVSTDTTFHLGESISSRWQLGLNYAANETQRFATINGANQSAINIYTGVAASALTADAAGDLNRDSLDRAAAWNTYLQTQTTFGDRLILNLSGAFVGDREETISVAGISSGVTERDSGVTPNLGLVFLPTPQTALYASYATSYSLPELAYENAVGASGGFDPTEGENVEIGAKADLWGDLLAASVSLFQTELNNTLVQSEANELNPNGNRYYRQVDGGRSSQGVEFEITLAPINNWSTTFTYAYIDAHDRNPDGSSAGTASMTPRHALSLFSRYAFASDTTFAGWSLQAGLITQSARWGGQSALSATNPDPLRLKSFARVDLGVAKTWNRWNVALNIENLLDEATLAGGSTGLNLQWANPRNLTLRVARTW